MDVFMPVCMWDLLKHWKLVSPWWCVRAGSPQLSALSVQVPGAGTQGAGTWVPMLSTGIALAPLHYTPHSPIAPGGAPRPVLHSLQQGSSSTAATDQFWKMERWGARPCCHRIPPWSSVCRTRPRRSQREQVCDAFPHLGAAWVTYLLPK